MDMDSLYTLAYRFRNGKIWKRIFEDEIFAVKLPDGIGYCCITGQSGGHMSLSVYRGEEAFRTLYEMLRQQFASPFAVTIPDCIQCSVEKRDMFGEEELDALRDWCRRTGQAFRSPYPQFTRYKPYCVPWHVMTEDDAEALRTALEIVDRFGEFLADGGGKERLGLKPSLNTAEDPGADGTQIGIFPEDRVEYADDIPLYSLENGELRIERIPMPRYTPRSYPTPEKFDEEQLGELTKRKQSGVLECEVIRLPAPTDGEPPFFPAALLAVEAKKDGRILTPVVGKAAAYDPEEVAAAFLTVLLGADRYPKRIRVRTEETRALLAAFCREAKIWLDVTDKLPHLDEAEYAINEDMADIGEAPSNEEFFFALRSMSLEELKEIPDFVLKNLLEAEENLPPDIAEKVRKALGKR